MFKLYEIRGSTKKQVEQKGGLFEVHELGTYQIEYTAEKISSNLILIEDEYLQETYIKISNNSEIFTNTGRYFENYFGFAKLSINNETFQLNILGEKFELKEIEELILYLFYRNHLVLSKFVSKSSIGGATVYNGKEYVFSSKYLQFVSTFCRVFEDQYNSFKRLIHSLIRKRFRLANYNSQSIDFKSIEWVLQNLDTIQFSTFNVNHPDSVVVNGNFGVIEKIGAEENAVSFDTYENQIILGSFEFVQSKLSEIKQIIKTRLGDRFYSPLAENSLYSDFRDLQVIPFLRLLSEIDILEKKIIKLSTLYSNILLGVKPKNQIPKLTPVFYRYRHYQNVFNQIRLLRQLEYNLDGEIQLLNIKKLSELYELYNLNVLSEILDDIFKQRGFGREIIYDEHTQLVSQITYSNSEKSFVLSLYYEPNINNFTEGLDLITIGNTKLVSRHCKPDFVISITQARKTRFCILDSKYSKFDTVSNSHMSNCIKKYILDVGVRGQPYQKPDYLILLHPDSSDEEINIIYNTYHYPQFKTIISKPNFTNSIKKILTNFLSIIE